MESEALDFSSIERMSEEDSRSESAGPPSETRVSPVVPQVSSSEVDSSPQDDTTQGEQVTPSAEMPDIKDVITSPLTPEDGSLEPQIDYDQPGSSGGIALTRGVCRDFLRNVCFRGAQCKFAHPGDSIHGDLVFCHDYQNLGCKRFDCKFLHASKDDERKYRESGKLPQNLGNVTLTDTKEPICKDFLKRQCHRGRRCKFRHEVVVGHGNDLPFAFGLDSEVFTVVRCTDRSSDRDRWSPLGIHKRRRTSATGSAFAEDDFINSTVERENRVLKVQVEELQKQVKDLMSTNEFLLQQNAELRLAKQTRVCQGITGTVMSSGAVIPNSVLTSNLAGGQVSACPMTNGVLPSAVLSATAPITSEPTVNIVPVSSIITVSSTSAPLVSGYPIVTSQGQLRYNPTRT